MIKGEDGKKGRGRCLRKKGQQEQHQGGRRETVINRLRERTRKRYFYNTLFNFSGRVINDSSSSRTMRRRAEEQEQQQ